MKHSMGPDDVLMMGRGFMASRLVLTAANLGLFAELPATAREVASLRGWNAPALERLMDALAAIRLLEKRGDRYAVTGDLVEALGNDPEKTIAPMLEHMDHLWENWSRLSEIVRNGKPTDAPMTVTRDPERQKSFIGAMHVVGQGMARRLVAELNPSWAGKLLDVGGASGTYTLAFLEHLPDLSATLFDLPPVIPLALERIRRKGMEHRVTLAPGDFYQDPLPPGHDLIWLSAIIHQNGPEENRALFRKCLAALVPGGRVWIRDHVMEDGRVNPAGGAMFDINMLVGTPRGATYTFGDISRELLASGFTDVRLIRSGEQMDAVVEGVKPA